MKRHIVVLLCVMCVVALPLVSSAHSGGTDSDGGHYDHSTGKYHYHHGEEAHAHWGDFCTLLIWPIFTLVLVAAAILFPLALVLADKIKAFLNKHRTAKAKRQSETDAPKSFSRIIAGILIRLFLLIVLACVVGLFFQDTNPAVATVDVNTESEAMIVHEFLYSGAVTYYRSGERFSTLKVLSSADYNYVFVSLIPRNDTEPAVTACIHARDTVSFAVPRGVYDVYCAEGDVYYGPDDLFGPNGLYYKLDKSFMSNETSRGYSVIVNALNREDEYTDVSFEEFPR